MINRKGFAERESKRLRRLRGLAICLTALLLIAPARAAEDWARGGFVGLFPSGLDGWQAEPVAVEELQSLTTELEKALPEKAAADRGLALRLRLTRPYLSGDERVEMSIDTQDVELAAMVKTAHEQQVVRDDLAKLGYHAELFGTRRGIRVDAAGQQGVLLVIGSVGVVTLSCAHEACAADLQRFLAALDLDKLDRFADTDHRRK